jgi:hypothetical protein
MSEKMKQSVFKSKHSLDGGTIDQLSNRLIEASIFMNVLNLRGASELTIFAGVSSRTFPNPTRKSPDGQI